MAAMSLRILSLRSGQFVWEPPSPGAASWVRASPATTRETSCSPTNAEIYEQQVRRQGWSLDDFAQFSRQGIAATLL